MDALTPSRHLHHAPDPAGLAPAPGTGPGEEIEIAELLRTLWRRRWIIIGTVLLLTGIASIAVFQITPRYTATTRVMIDTREQNVIDIESVLSGGTADAPAIESEVAVLTSRVLAQRVVDALDLQRDPEFNPALRPDDGAWQRIRSLQWLPASWREALMPRRDDRPVDTATQERLAKAAVVDSLLDRLRVESVGRSYVIGISFESTDPFKAARIANEIADQYLVSQLEDKFEATARANDWLRERLEGLRRQVEESERAVVAYRRQHNIANTEQIDLATQQVSELNTQLTLARAERAAAEARLAQVDDLVRRGGVDSAAQVLSSSLIQNLRGQEAELQRGLSELLTRYGERHPRIVNARAELDDLRASIAREVQKIVQNLQNEVEVARARERALDTDLQTAKAASTDIRAAEIGLAELQREAEANRTLYETFLNRFKETSDQQEIQQPDARIISPADVPRDPSFPRKKLVVALVFCVSILVGIAFVVLVERLDNGFRHAEQIRKHTGLATLALVPMQTARERRERPDLVLLDRPGSQFAEAMRTLLVGVLLSDVDTPPRSVLVTSALPGEGKSLTALSLARVAALGKRRTLLIDCDVRRPSLQRFARPEGVAPSAQVPGLTDVLADPARLDGAIFREQATGLDVLLSGSRVPNPQDMLQSQTFASLIEELADRYDMVVLDSAPVMAVADALTIGAIADRTVFVTQWERTPRTASLTALRQLVQSKARLAGVVLSQVNIRRHARYAFGDHGQFYGYYREYYQE